MTLLQAMALLEEADLHGADAALQQAIEIVLDDNLRLEDYVSDLEFELEENRDKLARSLHDD